MSPRILVVEDDSNIARSLVGGLRRAGFDTELACDGLSGERTALSSSPDLIILDLNLPRRTGFELLESVQNRLSVPIVVLRARPNINRSIRTPNHPAWLPSKTLEDTQSACGFAKPPDGRLGALGRVLIFERALSARTELEAGLRALELGAVDFVPKPFWMDELLARIRTRLGLTGAPEPHAAVRWGDAELDMTGRRAAVAGVDVGLTPIEFNIVACLVAHPGRVVSRATLAEETLILEARRGRFELRVEDDGLGVPAVELPHLVERSYRSEAARTKAPGGKGLGLAIASEVCSRCKIELRFEQNDPRGLRVTMTGSVSRTVT